MSESNY
ncbi:cytochrome c oxidase subunit 6B, putative, partial [Plasmodium reichenowi]